MSGQMNGGLFFARIAQEWMYIPIALFVFFVIYVAGEE